ncbi:MAG: dephospho-CoA kinase [Mycobacteriales bacterium]
MHRGTALHSGIALIGLTGGIGSGKSTVAATLAELGAVVIDADALSREVLAPGTSGLAAVVSEFGIRVLRPDGLLNRRLLAKLIFADDEARTRLNQIVHPLVRERTRELIAAVSGSDEATNGGAVVVHDVPLLLENQMTADYHLVIAVLADESRRVERLRQRGLSPEQARSRMAHQVDDAVRPEAADVIFDNNGSRAQTLAAVTELWHSRIAPLRDNLAAGKPAAVFTSGCTALPGEYDPTWPLRYRRLAPRLAVALGDRLIAVEHVGATAVAGMSAPGVIDVRVWVSGEAEVASALARCGWFPLPTVWRAPRFGFADPGSPARLYLHIAAGTRGADR